MGSLVSVDDIEPGQILAVHSFVNSLNCAGGGRNQLVSHSLRNVGLGAPLRVNSISLPFLACEPLVTDRRHTGPVVVDVRQVSLCKLSPEYVAEFADAES